MTKYCPKCDTVKPVAEFNRNNRRGDGFQCYCRDCQRAAGRAYSKTEARKESKRRWGATEAGRASSRRAARKFRESEKGQAYAHQYNRSPAKKESVRRYNNTENGRAVMRRKWRNEGVGQKAECRDKTKKAIKSGRLTPQPCEECNAGPYVPGGERVVHAHHDDYSKPLDVRWLCMTHHIELHGHTRYEQERGE